MNRLLLLLLLIGCREAPLAIPPGGFEVFPQQLEFTGPARLAQHLAIEVRATGVTAQTIHLDVDAPFSVEPADLALEGGGWALLTVSWAPRATGSSSATLHLASELAAAVVELQGVAGPSCAPPSTCHQRAISSCLESPVPDGEGCATACIGEGQCDQGECVGKARSCDDRDRCTADSCDPDAGCLHPAVECAASDDPCKAAYCDPSSGCQTRAVDDGTACGESNCSTSRVCLAGACTTRSTPDGARCGAWSPCQDPGTCSAGSCHRPPPHFLVETWSYTPPYGEYWAFDFPGLVDPNGNLYWWEGQPNDPFKQLVSMNSAGALRFRVELDLIPLHASNPGDEPGVMLLVGPLVILTENSTFFSSTTARVEGRRADSGALVWTRDVLAEVKSVAPCIPSGWTGVALGPPVDDGAGGLYLKAIRYCGNGQPSGSVLVSLDAASGAVRWWRFDADAGRRLISDVQGNGYFLTSPTVLTSVDRLGNERWRRTVDTTGPANTWTSPATPLALYEGRLVQANHQVIDLTGGPGWSAARTGRPATVNAQSGVTPLMGPGFVGLFSQSAGELTYSGYDLDTGQRQWSYPFPGAPAAVAQPVLMDSGSTLVSVSQFGGGVSLTEISKDGIELFSCELPIPAQSALLSSATLRNGRYTLAARLSTGTVVVLSFALPGFEPAPHGWVTAAGKMTRQGHAR